MYSIGSKKKKVQQVDFNNPQDYIIPESGMSALTREVQLRVELVKRSLIITVVQVIRENLYGRQNPDHLLRPRWID